MVEVSTYLLILMTIIILYTDPFLLLLVVTRDSQGMTIPIDNFSVRFKAIDGLDEPDHQAVRNLINDVVKSNGETSIASVERYSIKERSDVTESYLDGKLVVVFLLYKV